MIKISLETRHAMLSINEPAELQAALGRIAEYRSSLLATLHDVETNIQTDKGREIMRKIRRADDEFWRLGQETVNLIKQENVPGAFALLNGALVPARNLQLEHIAEQIDWQRQLMADGFAETDALIARAKVILLVALAGSLLTIGGFVVLLVKSITSRLSTLQDVIVRVEQTGDLKLHVGATSEDEVALTAEAFDRMMSKISQVICETRDASNAIASAAKTMAQTVAQVESSSDVQSGAASTVAAAIEETSVSLSETSRHAQAADETAKRAKHDITSTLSAARETAKDIEGLVSMINHASDDIGRLAERSRQIDGIVKTIKDIADQTNLLALNAAIEAARAGEQGRGFAVVADEVRKLAENTAKSTSEISSLVNDIQKEVDAAVSRMEIANKNAGETREQVLAATGAIDAANADTERVSDAVRSITNAAREQDVAVQQVAQQIEQIAQMTEANTARGAVSIASRICQSIQGLTLMASAASASGAGRTFSGSECDEVSNKARN